MKFEIVKSYILVILVGLSLLLTFNIWNYKSDNELLYEKNNQYLNESDYYIEGKEKSKHDIVKPNEIIFQHQSGHYAYKNPKKSNALFNNMQTWTLYDVKFRDVKKVPNDKYQLEFHFPAAVPMETISSLFSFNEEMETGQLGSFKRMFITFNQDKLLLRFHFLSLDGRKELTAVVNDATKYEYVWKTISNLKGMQELMTLDNTQTPVYFPSQPTQMTEHTFSVNDTSPKKLVNALFPDPSAVRRNVANGKVAYYSDTRKQMKIYHDQRIMEFTDPSQTDTSRMKSYDLLDKSIVKINDHKGWTGHFYLDDLDSNNNEITYLLHYDAYPVISRSGLSMIKQGWRNQELYQYKRPLFSINNSLKSDKVDLPSGAKVKDYIKNHYQVENISEVTMGYSMDFQDGEASSILSLEPAWFIKYNGSWRKLEFAGMKDGKVEVSS